MRFVRAQVAVFVVAAVACRGGLDGEQSGGIVRLSPTSVGCEDGWKLFDRSLTSGFTPGAEPVRVELARNERLAAIKVRGGAPYTLDVRDGGGASIGFAPVDLAVLGAGWHTLTPSRTSSTSTIALHFTPHGAAAEIPEVELWGTADDAEDTLMAAARESSQVLTPGACATFHVQLARPPALFERAHLAYSATGALRPFVVERAINNSSGIGGSWLRGDATTHELRERIDPEQLAAGANTVRLCSPGSATDTITVSNVRLLGELDAGRELVVSAGVGDRDPVAFTKGHAAAPVTVGAGESVVLHLDRLIAPDAVVLDANVQRVDCVSANGTSTPLPFDNHGDVLKLQGGERACAALSLQIRDAVTLGDVDVVGSTARERVDWPHIVVTSEPEHFGTVAWVGGYVAHPHAMTGAIRVDVDKAASDAKSGEFGALVARKDATGPWTVAVSAHLPDGTEQTMRVLLTQDRRGDVAARSDSGARAVDAADVARFGKLGVDATARADMMTAATVKVGTDAGVVIPAGAVMHPTTITARRLDTPALPPLDAGMINVTAPEGQGYEYLPHHQRFARDVDVIVPFDPKLIPDGMTEKDVNTYFYDDAARHWSKLPRASLDLGQRVVHSRSDHFTIMINAVLAVPSNPTPLSFDPTALSSIAAASPAAGVDLIEAPSATSTGDARTALPVRVPPGRGAYTPSLSISYSSTAENGWLGVGWDVALSRIEIDTRWGVPRYTPDEELRYLLDGAELVPTLETEGPTCPGARRYYTRVEGAYMHILRCGTTPSSYYWLVHDRNGTTFTYGGAGASLASTHGGGIFRWHVRTITDVSDNTTTFTYQQDDVAGTEPSRELYPARVDYTSHPTLAAAYSIQFVLDDGSRPDKIINARGGFKSMTRRLLREIRVTYQNQPVRDYVLTYKHGQFGKTLLASTRVYGATGCNAALNAFALPACGGEFHEHTFDYERDTEGFGPVTRRCAEDGNPDCNTTPVVSALTKSRTSSWGGGLTVGVSDSTGTNEVSGTVSGSFGDRNERIGTHDFDGDGAPDEVYYDSGNQQLRVISNNRHGFSVTPLGFVDGLSELGVDEQRSWSVDVSGKVGYKGLSAGGSIGYANATARGTKFLTDIDGDGYIDFLVADGKSKRSEPCATGICFRDINYKAVTRIDPTQDPSLTEAADDIQKRAIPAAPVLQWIAPYTGTITVGGTIGLARPGTVDGISVGLFHDDAMLGGWSVTDASAPLSFSRTLDVRMGEAIYLYVMTGADDGHVGLVDEAVLSPLSPLMVQYTKACKDALCTSYITNLKGTEPTGADVFTFMSPQLRVVSATPLRVPYDGKVLVHGDVVKTRSSAPLRYCLQRFAADATSTDYGCSDPNSPATNVSGTITLAQDSVSTVENSWAVDVTTGAQLVLRVEADYSFDPSSIAFLEHDHAPRVLYTQACVPEDQNGCTTLTGDDAAELALSDRAFGFFAAPVSPPEPAGAPPEVFVASSNALCTVSPFRNPLGSAAPITVAFRSDRRGTLTNPHPFVCAGTCTVPGPLSISAGESISVEVIGTNIGTPVLKQIQMTCGEFDYVKLPLIFRRRQVPRVDATTPFVGRYRGWNTTFWNEKETFAPASLLAAYSDMSTLPGCAAPPASPPNPDLCSSELQRVQRTAFRPAPAFDGTPQTGRITAWVAPQSPAFVMPNGSMYAAGIGGVGASSAPDVLTTSGGVRDNGGGLFAPGYARLSVTRSFFAGLNLDVANLKLPKLQWTASPNLDLTVTRSWTKSTTDVIDLTGDGIPDVIAGNKAVQGTLDSDTTPPLDFQIGVLRERVGTDYTFGVLSASMPATSSGGHHLYETTQKQDDSSPISLGTTSSLSVGRAQTTDDIIDVNGDGLPDVVQRRGSNINVRYNLGTQLGAWETIGTIDPQLTQPIDGFDSFERATSVLGDVLDTSDKALAHETTLTEHDTFSVGFDLGVVKAKASRTQRKTSSRTTRELADLNGDGLPDLLIKRAGEPIKVQYNLGSTFGPVSLWTTPPWSEGTSNLELSPTFASDFASVVSSGVNIVTGADVLSASGTDDSKTYGGGFKVPVWGPLFVGANGSHSVDQDQFELALIDVTGDGHPDHVLHRKQPQDSGRVYVKSNQVTLASNFLVQIHQPLGGSVKLGYITLTGTRDMPHDREVLSRVEVDDGIELGAGFASPNLVTTFQYENGYFDRNEKQFFGFAKVTSKRADGGTVEQDFENHSMTLHGRITQEIRRDPASNVLQQHLTTYEVHDVEGPSGPLAVDPACVAGLHVLLQRVPNNEACKPQVAVVVRDQDVRGEVGTAATKSHRVDDTNRDRFGNVLMSLDGGDSDVLSDLLLLQATYQNDTSKWILGRALTVQAAAYTTTGGLLLRSRSGTYDASGRLTSVSVDTGSGLATSTYRYDAFGNLNHVETPPNANGQTQTYDVAFDPTVAAYPVRTTDGFGYSSTAAYDLRFGTPTVSTDTNGAQLTRAYDGFGRLTSVRGPYDTASSGITLEYHPTERPARAVSITRDSAPPDYTGALPAPVTTVTITDGLGRAIELRKTAVVNGVPGMTTSGLAERDNLARVTKTWQPFFTAGASTSSVTPTTTLATSTAYDVLDRPTTTTYPDGLVETTAYMIAAPPGGVPLFETQHTIASPPLRVREAYSDYLGRMRAYVEHPTATTSSVTTYDYSPVGDLTQIVDAEGHETTMTYDLRGLRTSMSNADTGLREHKFDLMGNQIALIEPNHRANGTQVTFRYDRNRPTKIDYPSKPDVTYEYGAPGAPNGRAGRLTRLTDETGTVEYEYGALGEARGMLRTFAPAGATQPLQFEQRFTYDSLGRQLQLRYPDGERITNAFDAAGALAAVTGDGDGWQRTYATGMLYDVFGNRTRMEVGHVVTTWAYEPARVRLSTLTSTLTGPTGATTTIQNLHYTYDPADNPVQIDNNLGALTDPQSRVPGPSSLALKYDGVDRLVDAKATAVATNLNTVSYDETFGYSASHNLTAKLRDSVTPTGQHDVWNYQYQYSIRPHLPDQVGTLHIEYDPSGNPKHRVDSGTGLAQDYVWDDDDRLVQLTDTNGVAQHNLYDAHGLRVRRKTDTSTGSHTTIFASQYFNLEGEQLASEGGVKHIFAGDQRIATVLGHFQSTANPAAPPTPGAVYYVHGDNLGSTSVITDDAGNVHESIEYFVDGEPWIDRAPTTPVNGFLFNGKSYDPETKLYDYGQRFYDPRTSLWLGVDPAFTESAKAAVGKPMMLSVGAFSAQSPARFIDPDGRDPDLYGLPNPLQMIGDSWSALKDLVWDKPVRVYEAHVEHRVVGAGKVAGGVALAKLGMAVCAVSDGFACGVGFAMITAGADLGSSGITEIVTNKSPTTLVGKTYGPDAQNWEEAAGDAAGFLDMAGFLDDAFVVRPSGGTGETGAPKTNCFAAGTLVSTRDGLRPIEELAPGDLVWARDPKTRAEGWKPVTRLFITPDRDVIELTFEASDGTTQTLRTTREHPLWSLDDGGWDTAGHLSLGERVDAQRGTLRLVRVASLPKATVYNLEVEDAHTYFVGAAGVWVHNASCRGFWEITNENTDKIMKWGDRPIYRHKSTKLWWSKDTAGHGGSAWKVFKEQGDGLHWIKDADQYGDYLDGKHKGPTGMFIPWSQLSGR